MTIANLYNIRMEIASSQRFDFAERCEGEPVLTFVVHYDTLESDLSTIWSFGSVDKPVGALTDAIDFLEISNFFTASVR
jgi:hypothetical protein